MKVFILSAGSEDSLNALLQTSVAQNVSLLQNQVLSLLLLGCRSDQVFLVLSENDDILDEAKTLEVTGLGINVLRLTGNSNRSFSSILELYSLGHLNQDTLFLNGDTYFDTNDIEKLINPDESAKILVETRYNRNSPGLRVVYGQSIKVLNSVYSKSEVLPWDCYSGAAFFPMNIISGKHIWPSDNAFLDISYIEYFSKKVDINFKTVNRDNRDRSYEGDVQSRDLVGGSFAGLREQNLVKKYASKDGYQKLVQEINWLNKLNSNTQRYFTKVLEYEINDNSCWYTMPRYSYASMRKLLITGLLTPDQCVQKLDKIMEFLFESLYSCSTENTPTEWLYEKHFRRFYTRFELVRENSVLNDLFSLNQIIINGVKYKNLKSLIDEIQLKASTLKLFTPGNLVNIHGDLHLQNILVDINTTDFILVDPRGELRGSDLYYDMGKLWHSVNGLYDLIHTDIARLRKVKTNNAICFEVDYGPISLINTYSDLKVKIRGLLSKYLAHSDPNWYLKTLFNEAMHFSSLFTFHLKHDNEEERACLLYLVSVQLTSELLNEMEKY